MLQAPQLPDDAPTREATSAGARCPSAALVQGQPHAPHADPKSWARAGDLREQLGVSVPISLAPILTMQPPQIIHTVQGDCRRAARLSCGWVRGASCEIHRIGSLTAVSSLRKAFVCCRTHLGVT